MSQRSDDDGGTRTINTETATRGTVLKKNIITFLEDSGLYFVSPLILLFWTSGDVRHGFQSQG